MLQRCQASTWQCQEWCGHWNRNSAAWLGTFCEFAKCLGVQLIQNQVLSVYRNFKRLAGSSLDDTKNVFQWLIACLLFKNFRPTSFLMDLIFGKHLFVRDAGFEVLVASFKANLNPTPSASSAGTSGQSERVSSPQTKNTKKIQKAGFCEKPAWCSVRIFATKDLT